MEKQKSKIILVLLILSLLINCVSASSIRFVDAAYVGNGTISVTDPEGNLLTFLVNSSQIFSVENTTAYMLDYQAGGLYGLHQEVIFSWNEGNFTPPEFNGFKFYLSYFSKVQNIVMILYVIVLIMVVLLA